MKYEVTVVIEINAAYEDAVRDEVEVESYIQGQRKSKVAEVVSAQAHEINTNAE